jgi:hypothetical protein
MGRSKRRSAASDGSKSRGNAITWSDSEASCQTATSFCAETTMISTQSCLKDDDSETVMQEYIPVFRR